MAGDPFRHFLGVGAEAGPAALLGLGPPPHSRVRVETALRARLARVYAHPEGGTPEAEYVRQSLRRASVALTAGVPWTPPPPPAPAPAPGMAPAPGVAPAPGMAPAPGAAPAPGIGAAPASRPSRFAGPRDVLTEFDRSVLAVLVGFGGWNARSRAKLVALAASRGMSPAGLHKVVSGLSDYARAGGPPLGVSEIASGAGRLDGHSPRAVMARAPSRPGILDRLAAERWMPELREPSLRSTVSLSLFFGLVTLVLAALFLRALLPSAPAPAPTAQAPTPVAPGPAPVARAARPPADEPAALARFRPLPGFLGNAVPMAAANAASEARTLPETFRALAAKVSITDEPSEAVYRNWDVSVMTIARGWVLADESTRRENERAVRAVLYDARDAPAVGDRLLAALVPPRGRLSAPTQVWEGAWQAGMLGTITADGGLPASTRDRARSQLEIALGPAAIAVADFATAAAAWLDEAARGMVDVIELQPEVYDFWEMWISAERELGDGARLDRAALDVVGHLLATSTDLARPGPSPNVMARLLTLADFRASATVRERVLAFFDERGRIDAHDLWVLTSLLAQLDTAPWFGPDLVLPAEADETFRRRQRDRIARTWPSIEPVGEVLAARGPGVRVDARVAVRWLSAVEMMRGLGADADDEEARAARLLAAARLNEAAALLAEDRPDGAAAVLDEMEAALARATGAGPPVARRGAGSGRPRGQAIGRDGEWAEQFGAARRNNEERLTQLQALRAQSGTDLGPLDAEAFVRAAYLGGSREIRSLARAIVVERFVDGPTVALEMLDQFPDAPGRDGVSDTIQRYTGRVLPSERSGSWTTEARLALVRHALELLEGGTSRIDAVAAALRDSYARRAAVIAQDPGVQVGAPTPQAAAALVADAWRARASVVVARFALPDTIAGLARRRAIRHRLAEGPIQALVAEQLSTLEHLAYLVVAERPERREEAAAILADSARRRREAGHVLRQAIEAELAIARMWSVRMGLAAAAGEAGR